MMTDLNVKNEEEEEGEGEDDDDGAEEVDYGFIEKCRKKGYDPRCTCSVCRNRMQFDQMILERADKLARKRAEEKRKAEGCNERQLRKSAKKLRSGKKADEGCKLSEDWLD
jgi:hypothetical protein